MLHYLLLCNASPQNAVAEDSSSHFIMVFDQAYLDGSHWE